MKNTRDVALDVIKDVLERFAFMFTETEGEALTFPAGDDPLRATIRFQGKVCGVLTVVAPKSLCQEMAANVLGMDPAEIGETAAEDALKELINIICGTLTWSLYGEREVFHLSVPVVARFDVNQAADLAIGENNIALMIENRPVVARLQLIEDPHP
ncbi:MAG: chemotaxis protein CheX [Verrucomicrobiia bacterium]|jgi:chemotaxis protein CheY-P-specific phosphatase CheC